MTQAGYIDTTDITAYGFQADLATNQSLFDKLIVRASRLFDIMCGVDPGFFTPIGYPLWESLHVYAVGDIITPRTTNGHRYEVTQAGTSGASEPTYPVTPASTVTNGSIVLTENGSDVIAATDKIIYGSGGPLLGVPPYAGEIAVVAGEGFLLPAYVAQEGYLRVVDSFARTQDVGVPYPETGTSLGFLRSALVWQLGAPFTVTAVWGMAVDNPYRALVSQATMELFTALWRSKDPAFVQAIQLDANQMMFNPAIPKRARIIARSFRNARTSVSAFV